MIGWLKRALCFHGWQPFGDGWPMWSPFYGDVTCQRFDCNGCRSYEVRTTAGCKTVVTGRGVLA